MRKISKEELSEILNTHKIWLYSSHKLGSRADLSITKLSGASLYGGNLSGANLSGAYLYRANLSGAILSGAILSGAEGITLFRYEKHLAVAFDNNKYIAIGCKQYRTGNWVKNFEKIGKDEDYSNSQLKMYGQFINMINETLKEKIL